MSKRFLVTGSFKDKLLYVSEIKQGFIGVSFGLTDVETSTDKNKAYDFRELSEAAKVAKILSSKGFSNINIREKK